MAKKPATATAQDLGQLLSTKEAARLLGHELKTLLQWRHRNYGPPSFRVGGKVVWPEVPLLAWRDEQYAATVRGGGR